MNPRDSRDRSQNFVHDTIALIIERARDARIRRDQEGGDFAAGRLLGYYEVISLLRGQAETFAVPLDDLGLADLQPDRDLV